MGQLKNTLKQPPNKRWRLGQRLLPAWSRRRGFYLFAKKGITVLRDEGTLRFLRRVIDKIRYAAVSGESLLIGIESQEELNRQYGVWRENNGLRGDFLQVRAKANELDYLPLISVATPVFNVEELWLRKCVESVLNQIYPYWELCLVDDGSTEAHVPAVLKELAAKDSRIKLVTLNQNGGIAKATNRAIGMATGEFVAFLDHDDELAPEALFKVAELLNEAPKLDLIYSDEDKIETDGRYVEPFFKPDWSPDLLLSTNYICHLTVFRRALLEKIGGIRSGFEGSQDFDLLLRFTEQTDSIGHIPSILYHWRKIGTSAANSQLAKPFAFKAGQRALEDAIKRRNLCGCIEIVSRGRYRVRYTVGGRQPLISIIIPCKSLRYLEKCMNSVTKSTYPNYEFIVVAAENCSAAELAKLEKMARVHKVLMYDKDYTWAGVSNFATRESRGFYLIFLSEDSKVIEPHWLEAMLEHAQRAEIGVVGAKYLTSKKLIQHAGVLIGIGGLYGYAFRGVPEYAGGYFRLSNLIRNCSAVGGGCMMMRREVYEAVGGFDEEFEVAHADVDFCLRAGQAGYRVLYTPYAVLQRDEPVPSDVSSSQPDDIHMRQKWHVLLNSVDPYYNVNLSPEHEDFRLQL